MKISTSLYFLGLASSLELVNSFAGLPKLRLGSSSQIWSSTDDESSQGRPELVDQSLFIAAIDTLQNEIAKSNGVEYVKEENDNISYAIGRVKVNLSIPPQIDLIETPELVLVNGVTLASQEQGIKPLDTIVGVSSADGTFKEKTLALDIENTFAIIKAAIDHARASGETEIEFELNRLIKGYYK